MVQIIKKISLEVSKPNLIQAIVAKQYDNNSRFLQVTLMHEGKKIEIAPTSTVIINAKRIDGEEKPFAGEANNDGTATVPLTYWMLELEGEVWCDVSVIDTEGRKLTSTKFDLLVERASCSSGDITEDDNYDVLVKLIEDVSKVTPDIKYDPTSENAQSGIAVEQAFETSGVRDIFECSENLFDKSKLTNGLVISSTGVETSNSSYATSDYIELDVGTYALTKSLESGLAVSFISYYTPTKNFIRRTDGFDTTEITEKCYVRLSGSKARMTNVMLVKGDTLPTEYIPYKKVIKEKHLPDISGRKIVDKSLDTGKTDFIKINSNLINHRTIKGGYYLSAGNLGGVLSDIENYDSIRGHTDRIYLKPSTTYSCKNIIRVHLFNPNDDTVAYRKSFENYDAKNTFTTPDYETYAMLSLYIHSNYKLEWQLNEGEELLDYEKQQVSICGYNLINEINNVGGLSEIRKWNKVVIDKSIPFTLNEDVTSDDYTLIKNTEAIISLYDGLMLLNPNYITKTTKTVTTDNGTQTFARYDFIEPNVDENGNKHFEQNKVKIILSSGTHPEFSGIYGLFNAMREIANNPDLINIRRNCHFIVIPVLNPYGVDNSDRRNANKVDIARNFEVDWFEQSPTNADGTENGTYGGTTFLTEPESVYLDSVLKENKDAIFYASCHSFQVGVTTDNTPVNKPNLFMWCASATNYVDNIGSKVVDKVSRLWRNKYGKTTFANGNNLTDTPSTLLGTSNMASPNGSEGKQAIKYGIQGCTFEVCDWCRFNDNRQSQGYMTPFVVSRASEVYINLIGTVCDCYDYLDKKLL